jgi:general secretion pathway protein D
MTVAILVCFLTSFNSFAETKEPEKNDTISIDLVEAPLTDAIQLAIKGLIGKNYIIDPDIKNGSKKLTIQLKDVSKQQALKQIQDILISQNIQLLIKDDTVYIKPLDSLQTYETTENKTNLLPSNLIKNDNQFQPLIVNQGNEQGYTTYYLTHGNIENAQQITQMFGLQIVIDDEMILIKGNIQSINSALYLLRQFDRPSKDVNIKATVVEISNDNNTGWNIQAMFQKQNIKVNFGASALFRDTARITGITFDLLLSQMREDSKFNVLNTSTIRVSNGSPARINVGAEVPVLTNYTQTNNGQPIQSVEYRQSGLILDVTPKITGNNITVDLLQQLSNFNLTTTSQINSPTLTKRELKTTFNAKFNEIILLGGLDQNQQTDITSRLFGIPIGSTTKENKTSLYILIQFERV